MIAFPVYLVISFWEMNRGVRHLMILSLRSEEPRVFHEPVYRRSSVSDFGLKAFLLVVYRVSEASYRDDVIGETVPNGFGHLTLMDVRSSNFVAEDKEGVEFDRSMRFDSVLASSYSIVRLSPGIIVAAESCRIGRDDDLLIRKER
jgi:hypothetical protein